MAAIASPFDHLERRSLVLLERFIKPSIKAEEIAVESNLPLPEPDFDALAAFRLLSHAELEGYFEQKAWLALDKFEEAFKSRKVLTKDFSALIFLHLWIEKVSPKWSERKVDQSEFKSMAQNTLGFGRQFIKNNNGIKEDSIVVMSALMGFFADELDDVLVSELNQYGKRRGDVAHDSWAHNTRTFDSALIEMTRLKTILDLTKKFYEK